MDKHASLLLITYLCGLLLGIVAALSLMPLPYLSFEQKQCLNSACDLLPDARMMLALTLIGGAMLAYLSLLLSRGLYRLFFDLK